MTAPNPPVPDPPPEPPADPPPTWPQRLRRIGAGAGLLVAVPLLVAWLTPFPGWLYERLTAAPKATASTNCADGLCVTTSWPRLRGCDGATQVAMQAGGPAATTFNGPDDPRQRIVGDKRGGSWGEGHLYLDLTGVDGTPVQILNLRPTITPTAAPAWIYAPIGGCGATYNRVFRLDLDNRTLVDKGRQGTPEAAQTPPPDEPLGATFTVTQQDLALVRLDARSCAGNYQWKLDITFSKAGRQFTRTVGPFLSMGVAQNTRVYSKTMTATGLSNTLQPADLRSGPVQGFPCDQSGDDS